jgi:hypothetical protein
MILDLAFGASRQVEKKYGVLVATELSILGWQRLDGVGGQLLTQASRAAPRPVRAELR